MRGSLHPGTLTIGRTVALRHWWAYSQRFAEFVVVVAALSVPLCTNQCKCNIIRLIKEHLVKHHMLCLPKLAALCIKFCQVVERLRHKYVIWVECCLSNFQRLLQEGWGLENKKRLLSTVSHVLKWNLEQFSSLGHLCPCDTFTTIQQNYHNDYNYNGIHSIGVALHLLESKLLVHPILDRPPALGRFPYSLREVLWFFKVPCIG